MKEVHLPLLHKIQMDSTSCPELSPLSLRWKENMKFCTYTKYNIQ